MARANDVVWIDDLDDEVCWRLLERAVVGRVGFVLDGAPMILPVNFVLDGRSVVVRTAQTPLLEAIGGGARVAFEIDHTDDLAETGWSVLVIGVGEEVTAEAERSQLEHLPLHPWAPRPRDRWLRIRATQITGRAISRKKAETAPEGFLPYMPPD
jgi:nitroimidazol reductase NimA-like FMN-containing flavoprotein (pyridoxamine 5'-phosphate oxidase superfamily)